MRHIGDFLGRLKSLRPPHETVRTEVKKILSEKLGAELDIGDIRCQDGVVYITADAMQKSEIFMRRRAILSALADRLGAEAPSDIR